MCSAPIFQNEIFLKVEKGRNVKEESLLVGGPPMVV